MAHRLFQRMNFLRHWAQQHDSTFTGTFREFVSRSKMCLQRSISDTTKNAAVIAGIAAIISPYGEDAHTMRLIMRTFLERHPLDQRMTQSKTSQNEIATVRGFSPV